MTSTHVIATLLASGETGQVELSVARQQDDAYVVAVQSEGLGRITGTGPDMFAALVAVRRTLDQAGLRLLCNGARRNVRPSQMGRQMSEGRKAYRYTLGERPSRVDLCDIFDPAPADEVASVLDQERFWEDWKRSVGLPKP